MSAVVDLCRALGWLADADYREGPVARPEDLHRFHVPDYVSALQRAETDGLSQAERRRWNIGLNGNPIYGEVYRRPATAAGSSLLAAELLENGGIVHSPAGGTHHGRPDRASGFCYLNDPVLAILRFRELGVRRVAYLDLDAHHGDGVEDAFRDDPDVLTLSIHEHGRWPRTGSVESCWRERSVVNVPVPPDFNDAEFAFVFETLVLPTLDSFSPDALIVQSGVDALKDDPQSRLDLTNACYFKAVDAVRDIAPRLLVLGGGGYNPWAVARAWSGIWGVLNGHDLPDILPASGENVLRTLRWRHRRATSPPEHWFTSIVDPAPSALTIRDDVRALVRAVHTRLGSRP